MPKLLSVGMPSLTKVSETAAELLRCEDVLHGCFDLELPLTLTVKMLILKSGADYEHLCQIGCF